MFEQCVVSTICHYILSGNWHILANELLTKKISCLLQMNASEQQIKISIIRKQPLFIVRLIQQLLFLLSNE